MRVRLYIFLSIYDNDLHTSPLHKYLQKTFLLLQVSFRDPLIKKKH